MPHAGTYDCYAVTPPGVETLTVRELSALALDPTDLELRTASRVLVRVGSFHAAAFHELRPALRTSNGGLRVKLLLGTVPPAA